MSSGAIEISSLGKDFVIRHSRPQTVGQRAVGWLSRSRAEDIERFTALEGIDLSVGWGESLGLLGHNGSGKSTLLKIIAGIIPPSRGTVIVRGRVAPLIQLGVGFHSDLTGIENIYLNASLYGFRNDEIRKRLDQIVTFAELAHFIDTPLKHYSAGMQMRLGFAIAMHTDPEILLADEILAVGDADFRLKCLDRIRELRRKGLTLILVTHMTEQVEEFCDRFVRLKHGRIVERGVTKGGA